MRKIDELKGSEKLKIQAAVLEVMETENFTLDRDLGIVESSEDENKWIMGFMNSECTFDVMNQLSQKLGPKFKVSISSKSKTNFLFRVEGPSEEFVRLAQNLKPLQASQSAPMPSSARPYTNTIPNTQH